MKIGLLIISLIITPSLQANRNFDYERFSLNEFKKRPGAKVYLPKNLNEKKSWPLVISLHGFFSSPNFQNVYFRAKRLVTKKGFILVVPYGIRNYFGGRFWNATDYCCDFYNQKVDDLGHLKKLIGSLKNHYPVDPDKVFLVGHSNGGFLAHRFACESGEEISGIVSISGAGPLNPMDCKSKKPISILQIHGTRDKVIPFEGREDAFPGAFETIAPWSKINGCQENFSQEFSGLIKGKRSITSKGWKKCEQNTSVLLWTVHRGRHVIPLPKNITIKIIDHLFSL